jgi:hypothetical protein
MQVPAKMWGARVIAMKQFWPISLIATLILVLMYQNSLMATTHVDRLDNDKTRLSVQNGKVSSLKEPLSSDVGSGAQNKSRFHVTHFFSSYSSAQGSSSYADFKLAFMSNLLMQLYPMMLECLPISPKDMT